MPLLPGAQPWHHSGSDVGVVCCHGFTGNPSSMRPWAQSLAEAGFSVSLPRLPGHGTRWQDLADTRWPDWYGEVDRAFERLSGQCRQVFVAGLSMGGTLALRLAEQHGDRISGLALVNPSIMTLRREMALVPLIARVVPSVKGIGGDIKKQTEREASYTRTPLRAVQSLRQLWKVTRADLPMVRQPILLFHSTVDHVVEPENSRALLAEVTSTDVTERLLHDSYHVATMDNDAPEIFARSVEWIREHVTTERVAADE